MEYFDLSRYRNGINSLADKINANEYRKILKDRPILKTLVDSNGLRLEEKDNMAGVYLQGCKGKTAKKRLIDECGKRAENLYLFFMELNEKQADMEGGT